MAGKAPKRNRRPLDFRTQWTPQLVLLTVVPPVEAAGVVELETAEDEVLFGRTENLGWVLRDTAAPTIPISPLSVTLAASGKTLTAQFPPLTVGHLYYLTIPAWNESLRTKTGGYVAPMISQLFEVV